MAQQHKNVSQNKAQTCAANAGNNAVQLKDNRESSSAQKKLLKKAVGQESTFKSIQKKENNTGLPNHLKSGIENLSGHSMDDVKVHYNSDKPAQLNAHAYAQGSDIHIASEQEKHLPHEAWHVVQQKQGRVKPTLQMKEKTDSTENVSSQTIQRMTITVEPKASEKLGENKKSINTLHKLVAVMQHALMDDFADDFINIEITNTGELTPAWNHFKGTKSHPGKPGSIGVQLNRWYLEKVSIGDLVAMFIHEIGVHTFADKKMGVQMTPEGKFHTTDNSDYLIEEADQVNDHHNQSKSKSKGKIEGYPNAIEGGKKKGKSRQLDHVNLAKSLAGGKSTRSTVYTNLYLKSGDSIVATLNEHERDKALRELTFSFLFDLGRLAGTDDGGAVTIFKDTNTIGELMIFYRNQIVQKNEDSHKWLKDASKNIKTGRWQLRGFLIKQLATLAVSSNPLAKKAHSSALGGLAVGGALFAAGATVLPAIAAGAIVTGGLFYLQKRFGSK